MNRICSRCGNEIIELLLSEEQQIEIWGLLNQDLELFIVKKLKDEYGYSHDDAKIIIDHLNKDYGKCKRCDYDQLTNEHVDCPQCKAFNYNLNLEPPFNMNFCTHLEYKLDFEQLEKEQLRGFWCDGINHLPEDITSLGKSRIEKDKKIITKAWIGNEGQNVYEMTIIFGEKSIEKYKASSDLIDCIPDRSSEEWILIEPKRNRIEIKLK